MRWQLCSLIHFATENTRGNNFSSSSVAAVTPTFTPALGMSTLKCYSDLRTIRECTKTLGVGDATVIESAVMWMLRVTRYDMAVTS